MYHFLEKIHSMIWNMAWNHRQTDVKVDNLFLSTILLDIAQLWTPCYYSTIDSHFDTFNLDAPGSRSIVENSLK